MKMKHLYPFVAIALSTTVLMVQGCSNSESTANTDQTTIVKVMKIDESSISTMATGKVVPEEEMQIVPKIGGRVVAVNVKEGTVVNKGQLLAKLETADLQQQVIQAQAGIAGTQAKLADLKAGFRTQDLKRLQSGVEQAQSAYDATKKSYDRTKTLFDSGAVSQSDMDKVTADLDRTRTTLDQAKAQLELAKAGPTANSVAALAAEVERQRSALTLAQNTLDNTNITSPLDGIVTKKSVDPGAMAMPGAPMFTIVKMDQVQVEASIQQNQISKIKQGSSVIVKPLGFDDKAYQGVVTFISPVSDPNSTTFPVKIQVNNKDGLLRAGMQAEVYLGEADRSMKLPADAVLQQDGKYYVYKLDGNVVHKISITPKEVNKDWITVQNGLKVKDQIVLNPDSQLADGSKVTVE